MRNVFKDFKKTILVILKSKFKWILLLYLLLLFRISFIQEDGSGLGKIIQVITIFGMCFYSLKYTKGKNLIAYSYVNTNISVKSCLVLYSYGVLSALWAYLPQFAFFLAIQNVILMLVCIWLYSNFTTFENTERAFLYFCLATMLFEFISYRLVVSGSLMVHYLPNASSAALVISYCVGELFAKKKMSQIRLHLLKMMLLVSVLILITSTSSGANASAIFGIAVACFFSGKIIWTLLVVVISFILYCNPELVSQIIFFIMPGKTKESIDSATGRDLIWDAIKEFSNQRPVFGWGYGCVERIASDRYNLNVPDAHNNYIGFKGSLGFVGLSIAIFHFITTFMIMVKHRMKAGYIGLISAFACAMLNGYSYGFLSGKACSITIIYMSLIVLTFFYSKNDIDETDFQYFEF